jgi:hypothetical protein
MILLQDQSDTIRLNNAYFWLPPRARDMYRVHVSGGTGRVPALPRVQSSTCERTSYVEVALTLMLCRLAVIKSQFGQDAAERTQGNISLGVFVIIR